MRKVMKNVPAQLRRHLSAVLSKQAGQAVALCGEVGIGKTFTLASLLNNVPCKHLCLSASMSAYELARSLLSFGQSLQQLAPLFPNQISSQTCSADLAKHLAALAPFILVLEDVHELTLKQFEFIKQLADLVPKLRGVGLFVTSRSDVLGPFKSYDLERLDKQTVTVLLGAQAKGKLPEEGLDWVYTKSQGNPLFALEFWRYLSQQGYFWSDGSRWHWRAAPKEFVPPTLKAIIHEWVSQVAQEKPAKRVLEVLALLPEESGEDILGAVAGLEPSVLSSIQHQLDCAGILRAGKFVHPLLTQIMQETISPQEQTLYAERALIALEKAGLEPSALLIASANLSKSRTLQIYEHLASTAKAKGEGARAGYWLALASEQSRDEARLKLALEAAHLLRHSDKPRALELAQNVAHRPPHQAEAVYLCAELWVEQGNIAEAENVLALLHPQERATQRWWETLIRLHYTTHADYAEVLRLWESRPEFQISASPETVVYVCAVLGQRGQFEAAFRLSQPLLEQPRLEPYLRCRLLEMEATFYHLQGESGKAASQSALALALARTLNRPSYLAHLLRKEGIYAENQNRFDYMTACYREALQLLSEHGTPLEQANLESILASSLADQGEYEEAENLLHAALSVLEQSDNKLLHCDCRVGLALLYLDWQPRYAKTMALRHAALAFGLAQELGNQQMFHSGLTTLALAEAFAGNGERALELARESLHERYTASSEVRRARSLYALGMALNAKGERAEAIAKLSESIQCHQALGLTATAHRFALELDRITNDAKRAGERRAWFESQKLLGGAKIALRYFPVEARVEPTSALPKLYLLGPALLENEGKTAPYRGRKRLELLAYLLETRIAGKSEATLLELLDALYPETEELGAKAILKQLVYLLRNQLGHQAILSTASGYALGEVETDVEQFLKTGDSSLVRGVYLSGLGEGWYPNVREGLVDKFKEVVLLGLETDPREALRVSDIWQQMEPYDLGALSLGLRALQALGDERKLRRCYEQAVTRFQEVGEVLPPTSAAFLQDFVTEM
jgi:hypothetical protein